jgi:solute:Na+ symporter, SSS family
MFVNVKISPLSMLNQLSLLDIIVFVIIVIILNFSSLWAGFRKTKTETDYFMAGRSLRWWSVAGSIYGTNVSATQIIGMLGIGYSIGFAQSHYEVLAILPILALAYIFVPVYRKKEVFTLSQFLGNRYNQYAQLVYSLLNIFFILIQVVAGFYIGSRTLGLLFQGSSFELTYFQGIVILATVTTLFSVFGGMESVVIADNIQTILIVFAAILVGILTFSQPEIGGFSGLLKLDASQARDLQKMHIYLPTNHKDLPWSGAFSGLLILHFFYWTTNQYQVQRVLAAASDRDAKIGTLVAGFLKLTIPFFSIAAGVAAAYLFKTRFNITDIKPDDAFLKLMNVVVPSGYGIMGLILAGLTSAIFASIYSMLNSFTTLLSVDIYQKYISPQASDKQTVIFGKFAIFGLVALAVVLATYGYDPNSTGNFALKVSAQLSYLKPGIVVAFFLGIFWKKTNAKAAVFTMIAAPFWGILIELFYNNYLSEIPAIVALFGQKLNFMHRVFLTTLLSVFQQILLSKIWEKDSKITVDEDFTPYFSNLKKPIGAFVFTQLLWIAVFNFTEISTNIVAFFAGFSTANLFFREAIKQERLRFYKSDLFLAGILAGVTVWFLYFFA